MSQGKHIALIGNPNAGKSTLFNALTGSKQAVGNWPGVTIDKKHGHYDYQDQQFTVTDLPGTYSLASPSSDQAIDEQIVLNYLLEQQADVVINIIDSTNLQRNLYLTTQLLELQIPMIVVLNMQDMAIKQGLHIDKQKLSECLGVPVLELVASKKRGLDELQSAIASLRLSPKGVAQARYPTVIEQDLQKLVTFGATRWQAIRYLEYGEWPNDRAPGAVVDRQGLSDSLGEELDILLADSRYEFIEHLAQQVLTQPSPQDLASARRVGSLTYYLDKLFLHHYLGIPLFLSVVYLMFFFSINVGGAFQDFFDQASATLFVTGLSHLLASVAVPAWLNAVIANGLGRGINTVVTFIPVIGSMFFVLSFLEASGYMARAAFVMDRIMRVIGLPGKSFVPLIVSFGCNVPAVMGTRTLERYKDRVLVVMMSPFMSCGARLSVYALFAAAFFPQGGSLMILSLYLIGIAVAILTGLFLHRSILPGDSSPLILELPPYRLPSLMVLLRQSWHKLHKFLFKAGKIILPMVLVLGLLGSVNSHGELVTRQDDSLLSSSAQWIVPIFKPMGIEENNWQATVGILAGILAKEVVVGTLNSLYSHKVPHSVDPSFSIWPGLAQAVQTIPDNLSSLLGAMVNPIAAGNLVNDEVSVSTFGQMQQHFDGKIGAFAYLLFVLLYTPCVSTIAAIGRELDKRWMWWSVAWSSLVAYCSAVTFYQVATFVRHPRSASLMIGACLGGVVLFVVMLFVQAANIQGKPASGEA